MPRRWLPYNRMSRVGEERLHKLLGELEAEVMERMWQRKEATVRDIATELQAKRPVAYTTVMTVMAHLADKGLLTRRPLDKKTHIYRVALTQEEFLARASQQMVDTLVADFGDLALAQFLEAVEQVEPEKLKRLMRRANKTKAVPSEQDSPHGEHGSQGVEGHDG
mgnify:CR=1 FL=1